MLRSSFALLTVYRRTFSGSTRFHSIIPMDPRPSTNSHKAYIRALKEERVEIRIHYVDQDLGVDRWFNFNRSQDDNIQQIKERITSNIDKEYQKRKKRIESKNKKKENAQVPVEYKLMVDLKQNNEPISSEVVFKSLLVMNDVTLSVNDTIYQLDVNPPLVISLKLPNSAMAGFNIYPTKLEVENCDVSQCEFVWFKSSPALPSVPNADSDSNWTVTGHGMIYSVTNLDIGSWLKVKCIPKAGEKEGLPEVAITPKVVEAGPGPCPFEIRHQFTQERMNESGFRVVTYNILADLYADSDFTRTTLHPYCPPYALAIDYRKQLILKELIGYKADIICLQEVDNKVFDGDLAPILSLLDYQGVFSKKGGQVSEGMACFFNTTRFRLVSSETIILASILPESPLLADVYAAVIQNEKLMTRIMERTTALQLVVLESIQNGKRIVVANTHLYFHPDADHIRLLQANVGLRLAQDLRRKEMEQNKDVSLVFCGDFNSCPGYGVFEMMTMQNIDENYAAWSSNPEEAVTGLSIHNPVAMESACGTPLFTNYTSGFDGCLDYIFFEKSKLSVRQVVPLPSLEEVKQHVALPSIVFPSDHVSLVADLKWI